MYKIVFQYETDVTKVLYYAYSHHENNEQLKIGRLWYNKMYKGELDLRENVVQYAGIKQVGKKFVWAYEYKISHNDSPLCVEMGVEKSFDAALEALIKDRWQGDAGLSGSPGWKKVATE